MKRMPSKKSHSWWWNSHISPKNSKWLTENLEEMDHRVKEMLKLIEEEGDSFAKKAEMYYQKRPELISHVEDFYRMYRALAERYDQLTGELRKRIPSELQSQGSGGGSDVGSEPPSPSPEHTPDHKLSRPKPGPRAAGFNFFLGSGGSSDPSRKGSDRSSSSDSESESDDFKNGDGDSDGLRRRIIELESEILDVKEKLHEHEEKCSHSPSEGMENGEHRCLESKFTELEKVLVDANEKFWVSEREIVRLKQELEKNAETFDELRLYKEQTAELQERIVRLEADISRQQRELEDLKTKNAAIVEQLEVDGLIREEVNAELEMEAANLHESSVQEKLHLEAVITEREHEIKELKAAIESVSKEKSLLLARVTEQEHVIDGLRAQVSDSMDKFSKEKLELEEEMGGLSMSLAALKTELEELEAGKRQLESEKLDLCTTGSRRVEELNHDLDDLKLQLDMLLAERNELSARVRTLTEEEKSRDSRLSLMEGHLQQLHLEHISLILETQAAQSASKELRERVKELEEEVERQRAVISDAAEGKREAIRQLCFSLEHYRDGYCRLRQVLLGTSKRPPTAVLAT